MKYVKTFENFKYLLENAEAPAGEPAGEKSVVSPEESKDIINDTAAATKAEMAVKSAFSQKLKSKVAQAQSAPEAPSAQKESFIFENVEEGEILTKDNMQRYADSLVKKLPILKAGDKEVRVRGQKVGIPAGAEYEAYKAIVTTGQLFVKYKDRNGKFEEVQFSYIPSKEEIAHVTKIYSDFGKKLATKQKRSKLFSNIAKVALPLGFLAAIGGMVFVQGTHHGSGSEPFREIPGIVAAGAAALAGGAAAGIAAGQISKKIDVAEDAIVMFTALIKAFCDSLNLNMMEMQTVGDIQSLFTMEKIEVEVENTTTSAKVESVSNKLKGFDKF
jgi:hypothetical protein